MKILIAGALGFMGREVAAQAKALNDVLANEQAIWKNRYQQAYRNYQKRQNIAFYKNVKLVILL